MRHLCLLVMLALRCTAQIYEPEWHRLEDETMRHFQAVLRTDTQNPPGNEVRAVEYLKKTLERSAHGNN